MSYDYGLNSNPKKEPKSYVIALLLAFFLGCFGVHRFYVGRWKTGLAMLLLTITGCLSIASIVWWFIDLFTLCTNKFLDSDNDELESYNPGCAIIAGIFTIISFVIFVVGILAYLPTLFR